MNETPLRLKLSLLVVISLSPPVSAVADDKREWRGCRTQAECSFVKGCCGWVAANRRFIKEIKNLEKDACPAMECSTVPDFRQLPSVRCTKNVCETFLLAK